jgi:two-component system OmpR family response regulator
MIATMEKCLTQHQPMFDDRSVLSLTKSGERELHEPGTSLSPDMLEALVLIDGHSTVEQIIKHAGNLPLDVLLVNLNDLIAKNFVRTTAGSPDDTIDPGDFFSPEPAHTIPSAEAAQINAVTDANAEFLHRYGYYVNIAHRTTAHVHEDGRKPTVLIIDDDPDICKVLQVCLKLERMETRTATNREEIVAELRRDPLPDLVLLDVRLPDVNGFDILVKIRKHPALKELPVVMMTAEATREAVLKGLLGGADGFITKPFQIEAMVKTVKTALGLKLNPS